MAESISLEQPFEPAPTTISVDPGLGGPDLPSDVANRRAVNAHYGTGDVAQKSLEDYQNSILSGGEKYLRNEVAAKLEQNSPDPRLARIKQFSEAKGRPLTSDDIDELKNFIDQPTHYPDSVFEKQYAGKYLDVLKNTPGFPGSWYDDAVQQQPEVVQQERQDNTLFSAKQQMARTILEDTESYASQQSYFGWGVDQLKGMIPFHTELNLRGQVPESYFWYGLLGTNLEEQTKLLWRANSLEEFGRARTIIDKLKESNPSLAVTFARALAGEGDDLVFNNLGTLMDLSMVTSLKGIPKLGMRLVEGMEVRRANAQIMEQAAKVADKPPNVTAPAAAGDMATAATEQAVESLQGKLKSQIDPKKEAIEGFTSVMNGLKDDIAKTPGNFGQEFLNRLNQQFNTTTTNISNAIGNLMRVERIPFVKATREALEAFKESVRNDPKYAGISNSILDIQDIHYNGATNTHTIEFQIGSNTAELFHTAEEAKGFADVHGIVVKGTLNAEKTIEKMLLEKQSRRNSILLESARAAYNARLETDAATKAAASTSGASVKFWSLGKLDRARVQKFWGTEMSEKQLNKTIDDLTTKSQEYSDKLLEYKGSDTGATIVPHGAGYYLSMTKPLDETSKVIRDGLLTLKSAETPDRWTNALFGKWRTPEETLSLEQRVNRKVAAHAGSVLFKLAQDEGEAIRKLSRFAFPGTKAKERWSRWDRMIKAAKTLNGDDEQSGFFFKGPGDLDTWYRSTFGEAVSKPEVEAYFAYVRLNEFDRIMRNMNMYKAMSRVGTELNRFDFEFEAGTKASSGWIPSIVRTEFPNVDDHGFIVVDGRNVRTYTPQTYKNMSRKYRQAIETNAVKNGKILEIYDPELRPLKHIPEIGNARVRYMVVLNKTIESKPLSYDLLPRRMGGHFDYDYGNYIKQAKMRFDSPSNKYWYEGDRTLMPMSNRAMANQITEGLEKIRKGILAKDKAAVVAAHKEHNIPIPLSDIKKWFQPLKNPKTGLIEPARFDKNEPFVVVPRNKMIGDMGDELKKRYSRTNKKGVTTDMFKDGTREGSLARTQAIEYSGERDAYDLMTINNLGTAQNPDFKYVPAKFVDPIPTMNRGLARIINSTFMDDYKVFSMEHWLREAEPWLKEDWRNSPGYYFNQPANSLFKSGIPADIKARLETARFQMQQFTGIASPTQALLDNLSQKVADAIYDRFGTGSTPLREKLLLAPSTAIAHLTDPFKFMRTVTYHATIGLFSIPQMLVQSATYATIFGVAGFGKAGPGTAGAFLHQLSRLNKNPTILEALARASEGMGWKAGELLEAMNALKSTGFEHVGNEHILIDNLYSPKIASNGVGNFLNAGTVFFRTAEQNVRYGAWYTAYRMWRDENPLKVLAPRDVRNILENADILSGNMTKASKSLVQTGVGAWPTQFLAYQLRMGELFIGSRMNNLQRARMVGLYSLLFGVPAAIGVTGFPAGDFFRRAAIDQGYVTGDSVPSSIFMEGLPAYLGALVTGEGDSRKGNWYDIGPRFGGFGLSVVNDILTSDKTVWDFMGGASYSTLKGAFEHSSGFRTAMLSIITGGSTFPLKSDDFVEPLRQIASFNAAYRMFAAINTGNWVSKNNVTIDKTSPLNAVFMSITGLQTQQASDTQNASVTLKSRKEFEQYIENQFIKEMRKGWEAQKDDPEQGRDYFKRAQTWLEIGNFPIEKRSQAVAIAAKDHETLIQRLNFDMYRKDVPTNLRDTSSDAYIRTRQLEQGKQ